VHVRVCVCICVCVCVRVQVGASVCTRAVNFGCAAVQLWRGFVEYLRDIPFLVCALFVTLTLWRAPLLFAAIRQPEAALRALNAGHVPYNLVGRADRLRRRIALIHAILMLRDLAFLPPFLIIVATLYRAVPLVRRINAKRSKWIATDPILTISEFTVGFFRADASPTIRIRATKDVALGVRAVELRLLGDAFWGAVGNSVGKVLVNIAEGFQPVPLAEGLNIAYARRTTRPRRARSCTHARAHTATRRSRRGLPTSSSRSTLLWR
jgi:hypothetical protein